MIPHLDILYRIAASLTETDSGSPDILELGAGTGLLSSYVISRYPDANFTLIDFSDNMLNIAKSRFQGISNIKYIVSDYSKYTFDTTYDIIISALSIHHLEDKEKQDFYKKCFRILKPGGIFINADIIKGRTQFLESLYKNSWTSYIKENITSKEELNIYYKRMELDRESKLEDQLIWLKTAGFIDVDCMYKYYNFAVLFARKLSGDTKTASQK